MDVLFHHAIESHARCTPFLFFRLYAAGIAKCPHHVPLYQAWAILELRFGNVLTAKRLIGEALTRDKRNGSGWLIAANIEEKMGNMGLVGLILRRGLECAPGNPALYRSLAEHEISQMRIDSVSFSRSFEYQYYLGSMSFESYSSFVCFRLEN